METLAKALVRSIAYIASMPGDDQREDADVAHLEDLIALLRTAAPEEKEEVIRAVRAVVLEEEKSGRGASAFCKNLRMIPEQLVT